MNLITSRCKYNLLLPLVIINLSPILTLSLCDKNSTNSLCKCSSSTKFQQLNNNCECSLEPEIYKIVCPATNMELSLHVFKHKIYDMLEITCKNIEKYDEFFGLLPPMNLSGVDDIAIDFCPLPDNISVSTDLFQQKFGVTKYKNFLYSYDFHTFTKQHFRNLLKGFTRLEIIVLKTVVRKVDLLMYDRNYDGNYQYKMADKLLKEYLQVQPIPKLTLCSQNNTSNTLGISYDFLDLLSDLEVIQIVGNIANVPNINQFNKIIRYFKLKNFNMFLPSMFLANLPNLTVIDFDYVKTISVASDDIFINSSNIKLIRIINCNVRNLSNTIFESQFNLKELYITANPIQTFPLDMLKNASKLKRLKLFSNNIISFSSLMVAHNWNLQLLDLRLNSLTAESIDFEVSFLKHTALKIIKLDDNYITHIPENWHLPSQLEKLSLRYNSIITVNAFDFANLISADKLYLDLSWNKIKTINFKDIDGLKISSNRNLTTNISNNIMQCNCDLMIFLFYIKYDHETNLKNALKFETGDLMCEDPDNRKNKIEPTMDMKCFLYQKYCPSKCNCWTYGQQFIVNCSNAEKTQVPVLPDIGQLYLNGIELHVENNHIINLPNSLLPGYANVTKLYLAGNNLTKIENTQMPLNLTYLDLRRNRFQSMGTATLTYINQNSLIRNLYLSENPWICDCNEEFLFLQRFAQVNKQLIKDYPNMICSNTQDHFYDLHQLCSSDYTTLAVVLCSLGLLLGIAVALYFKYQLECKSWLYTHNMCLWCVAEEELDMDKLYDAFVSYSSKDEDFIYDHLIPELEEGTPSFKLCIHDRDWLVGEYIPVQISNSIKNSRRTIVVLSQNFIESVWAKMEFKTAHQAALNEGRARVIVIIYGELNEENLDSHLKEYLEMHTYLKWGDQLFWNKLRYAMPHCQLKKRTELEQVPLQNVVNRE